MIVLSWNCRGLENQATIRALKKLLREKNSSIVFLMETKKLYTQMMKLNERALKFKSCFAVACSGEGNSSRGGLCMLWKEDISVEISSFSANHISARVKPEGSTTDWGIMGVYGHPEPLGTSWLCIGDFNEILWSTEKKGGNMRFTRSMQSYKESMADLEMQDLGYKGYKYMWSNGREGQANVECWLDRMWANSSWRLLFPLHLVFHRIRYKSDHSSFVLKADEDTNKGTKKKRMKKLFRFEKLWLENDRCLEIVQKGWGTNNRPVLFNERTK